MILVINIIFTVFFNCWHRKHLLVTHFWNLTLKHQNHTPNLQNNTLILGLWLSFQFHKTLFAKHYTILYVTHTNLMRVNIMAKVFANVCFWDALVIFWMQCFIMQKMWGIFNFVCAILGFVCKVLKRQSFDVSFEAKFLMCVSSWKKR